MPRKSGNAAPGVDETAIESLVVNAFMAAHGSSATLNNQKRLLVETMKKDDFLVPMVKKITELVVRTLSISLSTDALRRHIQLLREVAVACRDDLKNDLMQLTILENVLPFTNAVDKNVRLATCSLMDALLRTLDQSQERGDFYDTVVDALKYRVHDKIPAIREKAVASISVFQQAKRDCDVTQNILCSLCEDTNSAVRRQSILSGSAKDVYFPSFARSTRDCVAAVRKEAWIQLGKYKFTWMEAYCKVYNVSLIHMIAQGLRDTTDMVRKTCTGTVTQCWLRRDLGNDVTTFLAKANLMNCSDVDLMKVANELLQHNKKLKGGAAKDTNSSKPPMVAGGGEIDDDDVANVAAAANASTNAAVDAVVAAGYIPFVRDGLTPANLLLWRASCIDAVAEGNSSAEEVLLPPLSEVAQILMELRATYTRPDRDRKIDEIIRLDNVDSAELCLNIFLNAFDVYKTAGYLSHADDTTRNALVKHLTKLLIVVPDTDPSQFVETVIASLKELTFRHPTEATKMVDQSLRMLFNELRLPKAHGGMQFDDVEGFGRKDQERRQELLRLQTRRERGEHVEDLEFAVETDTKFLLRMMHITRAYLGQCDRGVKIESFCTHMIHLGRNQMDPTVKAVATKALCITCLMNPEVVYTFMPLFIADAKSRPRRVDGKNDSSVIEAAVGAMFDLVCEYGLNFFDSPSEGPLPPSRANEDGHHLSQEESQINAAHAEEERRKKAEALMKSEDCHKVGGQHLFNDVLLPLMDSEIPRVRHLAGFSLCRMLSCNRIPPTAINLVVAKILLMHRKTSDDIKGDAAADVESQLMKTLDCFLASYAYSQPKRMHHIAEGGLLAFRYLTHSRDGSVAATATKLIKKVLVLCDAAFLQQVRDADPEFAMKFAEQSRNDVEDNEDGNEDDEGKVNVAVLNRSARAAGLNSSGTGNRSGVGATRLWRELGRYSLHEWIAQELIVDAAYQYNVPALLKVCVNELAALHLYQRDQNTWRNIQAAVDKACGIVKDATMKQKMKDFAAGFQQLTTQGSGSGSGGGNTSYYEDEGERALPAQARIQWSIEDRLANRANGLEAFGVQLNDNDADNEAEEEGYYNTAQSRGSRGVKPEVKEEEEDDDAMMGARPSLGSKRGSGRVSGRSATDELSAKRKRN